MEYCGASHATCASGFSRDAEQGRVVGRGSKCGKVGAVAQALHGSKAPLTEQLIHTVVAIHLP